MYPIVIFRKLNGANGRNVPGLAIVDPDAKPLAAVVAQEAWEAQHRLHNPTVWARTMWPLKRLFPKAQLRMEIMGHEVEVQAARLLYGMDAVPYRMSEVHRMKNGYGGLFDGITYAQLHETMIAISDEAARWVKRHQAKLERRM